MEMCGEFVSRLASARIGETFNQYAVSSLRRERLRAYLEARVPLERTHGLADDRRRAGETLARLREEVGTALGLA